VGCGLRLHRSGRCDAPRLIALHFLATVRNSFTFLSLLCLRRLRLQPCACHSHDSCRVTAPSVNNNHYFNKLYRLSSGAPRRTGRGAELLLGPLNRHCSLSGADSGSAIARPARQDESSSMSRRDGAPASNMM